MILQCKWSHLNVFQGDDAPRFLVRGELEVVETVVVEDEPPPLPALVPAALLPQPAFLVGVEEGVHQVVAVILGDLEGLRLDALVEGHEQLPRQVLSVVDASVHGDELLHAGLLLDAGVVEAGVEHDDGEAEHVAGVGVGEDVGVELAVALGECLHHPVNLLRLARQTETPQELSESLHQDQVSEVMELNKCFQHGFIEVILLSQIVSNCSLVQSFFFVQELRNLLRCFFDQAMENKEFNSLLWIHIKFLLPHCKVLLLGALLCVHGVNLGADFLDLILELRDLGQQLRLPSADVKQQLPLLRCQVCIIDVYCSSI